MSEVNRLFEEVDFEAKTVSHQYEVAKLLIKMGQEILERAKKHDESKLHPPEKTKFIEATKGLAGLTYGSPEYKKSLEKLGPALEHHYLVNRHHPQFHRTVDRSSEKDRDLVGRMSLVDVCEMLCDWMAATKRHDDGDIERSLEINKERFGISDQLISILRNTVKGLR